MESGTGTGDGSKPVQQQEAPTTAGADGSPASTGGQAAEASSASAPDPARLRAENEAYLERHPEVKRIMAYYTAQLLAERPTESIAAWSAAFFSQLDLKDKVERHAAAVEAAAGAGAAGGAVSEPPPDAKPPTAP